MCDTSYVYSYLREYVLDSHVLYTPKEKTVEITRVPAMHGIVVTKGQISFPIITDQLSLSDAQAIQVEYTGTCVIHTQILVADVSRDIPHYVNVSYWSLVEYLQRNGFLWHADAKEEQFKHRDYTVTIMGVPTDPRIIIFCKKKDWWTSESQEAFGQMVDAIIDVFLHPLK